MPRTLARAGAVLTAAALAVLLVAAPASAHVTVNPGTATQGGYAKLAFRVPNEKADAATVRLEIVLPADTPVRSVSIRPVAGWNAVVETTPLPEPVEIGHGSVITEAVSKITWTAQEGNAIQPGQFQEFEVSLGPLPEVDQLIFKALQTYSDGDVVRWIDEPTPGVELEHPAPILRLTSATDTADEQQPDTGLATGFGITGAVLGLAGLVLGLLAYRRTPTR